MNKKLLNVRRAVLLSSLIPHPFVREAAMLYMVIERFRDGDAAAVFRRFRERGRMLPEGLRYVNSWVASDLSRCFQLMECDDAALFEQWIGRWQDLVEFEVVPVVTSAEAADAAASPAR